MTRTRTSCYLCEEGTVPEEAAARPWTRSAFLHSMPAGRCGGATVMVTVTRTDRDLGLRVGQPEGPRGGLACHRDG